jgi:glyoxylase-like metal-dependent hydrolase (beta-lactamase superfamily II)
VTSARDATSAMSVGDLTILALSDGTFSMRRDFLSTPDAYNALATGSGAAVPLPVGSFLVPGDSPLLIDLGFGPGPANSLLTGGNLLDQLRRAGFGPENIETVALTHLHPDHVGWLATRDGRRHFRNARVLIAAADWAYFIEQGQGTMDEHIRAALPDLLERGRVELISGEHAIGAHVTAVPAPGHTPGHTVFAVHDHGQRALLLGDAIYCPQQLGHSDWEAVSDVDRALAVRTRSALERDLEQHDALAVGAHFPGLIASRILAGS